MKRQELEKAIKIFNKKFNCKVSIEKYQKAWGDFENYHPFDGGEDRLNLELGKDGNLYYGSRIYCQKTSVRIVGIDDNGEKVEASFVFDSLHDYSMDDYLDYLDDKLRL